MTLVEFLLARITEDSAMARRSVQLSGKGVALVSFGAGTPWVLVMSPDRVLAECEAKRRIVEACSDFEAIKTPLYALAVVYADHPDYRPEWKP